MMKKVFALAAILALAAAPLAFAHTGNGPGGDKTVPGPNLNCWHTQNPHDYYLPGGASFDVVGISNDVATAQSGGPKSLANPGGYYAAFDFNLDDCDDDGEFADFDGDYEFGIGGGFFPAGEWADDCGYTAHHGSDVHAHDAIWPPGTGLHESVSFTVGADPTRPAIVTIPPVSVKIGDREVVIVEGGDFCVTDGCVCMGDLDPDDWLKDCLHKCDLSAPAGNTNPSFGQPGGDGGYSVWMNCVVTTDGDVDVTTDPPEIRVTPPTTVGGLCSTIGHIYFPDTWP